MPEIPAVRDPYVLYDPVDVSEFAYCVNGYINGTHTQVIAWDGLLRPLPYPSPETWPERTCIPITQETYAALCMFALARPGAELAWPAFVERVIGTAHLIRKVAV